MDEGLFVNSNWKIRKLWPSSVILASASMEIAYARTDVMDEGLFLPWLFKPCRHDHSWILAGFIRFAMLG
ncbi:hypothetical protein VSDG_09494 [Cytospora chrysosperma]|uniref:Uncharacterized protein n=1 Tax=Cytospora chrysosperma TaxID=252740 RepID=A0A423VCJ9_CYTCH|nr:hypothetical protein VSDG_09494 [Valsa sordida]